MNRKKLTVYGTNIDILARVVRELEFIDVPSISEGIVDEVEVQGTETPSDLEVGFLSLPVAGPGNDGFIWWSLDDELGGITIC